MSNGIKQPLTLHLLHFAIAQDLLKQHAFVSHMLIDDPQPLFICGEDE